LGRAPVSSNPPPALLPSPLIFSLFSGNLGIVNGGTGTTTWQISSIPFFDGTKLTESNGNLKYTTFHRESLRYHASTTNFTIGANGYIPGLTSTFLAVDANHKIVATTTVGVVGAGFGSAGQSAFWAGPSAVVGDNGFFWDNTSKRLAIATTSANNLLSLYSATKSVIAFTTSTGLSSWTMGQNANDGGKFEISSSSVLGTNVRFMIDGNGKVGIGTGTTTPGAALEVVGDILSKGTKWTSRTSAMDNNWYGVTYGNGLFVAVAAFGTGNRVMTSPDGITWTIRASAADNNWNSVTYGNGLFVAVAASGSGNRVMTSPDGVNWTIRISAMDNNWHSVTYGNGMFVAVASSGSGSGNRVMTSPDGITWIIRTSAADNYWESVTYGNGMFVAVSDSGSGNRVMTSPDGITWTIRTSAADNNWYGVTYGNGMFVAVAYSGNGNRVMTSPDGITWTIRTSAADNGWYGVTYGNGLFVAVAYSGNGNRVMTSPDGITWTIRTSAADNYWESVTYGNGMFVAVSDSGSGNRVDDLRQARLHPILQQ